MQPQSPRPGRVWPRYGKELMEKIPAIIAALQSGGQVSTIERDFHVSNATVLKVRRDIDAEIFDYLLQKGTADTSDSPKIELPRACAGNHAGNGSYQIGGFSKEE
jgi:hypothetical protein